MDSFNEEQICSILKNAFDIADNEGNLENNCISANKVEKGVVIIFTKNGFNPKLSQELLNPVFPEEKYDLDLSDDTIVIRKKSIL
ncbi:MAG: hypothetical protein PHR61_03905 [Candidatus Absconditabacteria bacterium]|nr:hypothetical protein [Candidatus Absconditabacteria bacterium]